MPPDKRRRRCPGQDAAPSKTPNVISSTGVVIPLAPRGKRPRRRLLPFDAPPTQDFDPIESLETAISHLREAEALVEPESGLWHLLRCSTCCVECALDSIGGAAA